MRLPPAILAVVCAKICHHAEGVTCVIWAIRKRRIGHSLKLQPFQLCAGARAADRKHTRGGITLRSSIRARARVRDLNRTRTARGKHTRGGITLRSSIRSRSNRTASLNTRRRGFIRAERLNIRCRACARANISIRAGTRARHLNRARIRHLNRACARAGGAARGNRGTRQ
jgi:hypothetical protein